MEKKSKNIIRVVLSTLIIAAFSYAIGCSDVKFGYEPSATCVNFEGTCEKEGLANKYTFSFKMGSVTIVFIDDNSGSMYTEQEKMGDRFPTFMTAIEFLDWEMAIITTDVEQDRGQLLPFSEDSNEVILYADSENAEEKFKNTIQRPETLSCDSDPDSCPSGDERAICAANLLIDNGHPKLFTKDHIAFVILSDEDERSRGGAKGYPTLESCDLPETLVSKVKEQLGTEKTFSVHPIIIQPGDQGCLDEQNSQGNGVKGFEGHTYALLANPSDELKEMGGIVPGHTGSICAPDYGLQLDDIGEKIVTNSQIRKLPCGLDVGTDLTVTFSHNNTLEANYTVDENNFLTIDPVPAGAGENDPVDAGVEVIVSIKCPLNI